MKIPPPDVGAKQPTPDEIKGFERALDKAYTRLRERAWTEWLRHHGGKPDPADARVNVRITAGSKPPPAAQPKRNPSRAGLLPKAAQASPQAAASQSAPVPVNRRISA